MVRRQQLVLFFITLASCLFFHIMNWNALNRADDNALRQGVSIRTHDDPSYLQCVENYLATGVWKSNAIGISAYTTRSPGYGMVYLPFRFFLPQKWALAAMVLFQVFLFAISVSLIPSVAHNLGIENRYGLILALFVGVLPTFSGFLSYTLTEGITPSLVIFTVFLITRPRNLRVDILLWLSIGFLILIRPPMIVWLFCLPLLYLRIPFKPGFLKLLVAIFICLVPTFLWQIHLYQVTGKVQKLHAIYQNDSNGLYRSPHQSVWNFQKAWGQTGTQFHQSMNLFWESAGHGGEAKVASLRMIESTPQHVYITVPKDELLAHYEVYYDVLRSQRILFPNERPIPGLQPGEAELISFFDNSAKKYRNAFWFNSMIRVPSQVYKRLAFHSNLSLYIFQKTWRDNIAMEVLRFLSFGLHSLIFLVFPVAFFIFIPSRKLMAIGIPVTLYLSYLIFIQRGVEERYTLPFLLPMLLLSANSLILLFRRLKF